MPDYRIGCDAHKHYSHFAVLDEAGQLRHQARVDHEPGAIQAFLEGLPDGTRVALETVGNWYWIADEIEAAGCLPLLTHAAKAKVMMGNINKTDKLDAKGLAKLLHLESLPTVWLPPGEIRDERELHRTRMALSKLRTALKNRIHATLAKYAITSTEHSDIFTGAGRSWLETTLCRLPPETKRCVAQEIEALDGIQQQIAQLELRIRERVALTPSIQLLKTLPGVGDILGIVIDREIGSIDRFDTSGQFTSYAGLVPTVHASGGKTRFGHMRKPCNQYLKWAFRAASRSEAEGHRSCQRGGPPSPSPRLEDQVRLPDLRPGLPTQRPCRCRGRRGPPSGGGCLLDPQATRTLPAACRPAGLSQAGARACLTCIH
jgi:transposase